MADYEGIPLDLGSLTLGIENSNEEKEVTVVVENEKIIIENKSVTGSEEDFWLDGVSVFPNPVKNELNILLKNKINGRYSLVIYDVMGKIVGREIFEKKHQDFSMEIKFGNLPKGLYILNINSDIYFFNTRIIKGY